MGASSSEFVDFVMEQLAPLGGIDSGRFFGGLGLKAHATQFAMIMDNALYFVVDDTTRPRYQRMGSNCFAYDTRQRRVEVKRYFTVPADVLEDQQQLLALARESIATAGRAG